MTSIGESSSPLSRLVSGWRSVGSAPPYIHPEDTILRGADGLSEAAICIESYEEFTESRHFDLQTDNRLHVGLLPQPYIGNLSEAKIFLLLLNPGLNPGDYYAQSHVPEFRRQLVRNLHQENAKTPFPFLFLNPAYSWHPGFTYWGAKFRRLALYVAQLRRITHQEALEHLSRAIATLELVPYQSPRYDLPDRVARCLGSSEAMLSYVRETLFPRALDGEILLIVTRAAKRWSLPEGEHVIVYSGGEARGAHLTPASRGGKAVLSHLGF